MIGKGSLLHGRRGVIMGVANERSLAWGIAQECRAQGAELAFTYPNDSIERRLRHLVANESFLTLCDVSSDEDIDQAFDAISKHWGGAPLDFVVHSISFSDWKELSGPYVETSRRNFAVALDVSCYSFTAMARRAVPLMGNGGTLLTLSYLGAERVMPNYNVMGVAKAALETSVKYLASDLGPLAIRVNAISAGPIKTLASSGIAGMRHIVKWNELNAPLRRSTTIQDVGRAAVALISDMGQGMTGEIIHVDSGYHVVGMIAVEEAERSAEVLAQIGAQVRRLNDPVTK